MQPIQGDRDNGSGVRDPLRVTRRQLDPEDILDIVRRNKSWIAGPTLAGLVIAVVTAFLWPDTYISQAVIRVVPPQVPASFVPTNVTMQMSQRIAAMGQTVLSRGTLTSIIETYGLYTRRRQSVPLEDVIEQMRKDIVIGNVRNIEAGRGSRMTAFQITFAYENRYLAQKVVQDLVSRFINENTRERANQSAITTQFLRDQWTGAKNELDEIENKVTAFRIKNAGQLPGHWTSNVQQIASLETRLTSLNGTLNRLNQEKLVLNSEIQLLRDRISAITSAPRSAGGESVEAGDPAVARFDQAIRNAERQLASLLEQYTPNHPDVRRYEAQIELLRKEKADLVEERSTAREEAGADSAGPPAPAGPALTPQQAEEVRQAYAEIQNKQIQLRAHDLEIENVLGAINSTNQRIEVVQARLEKAPIGEQEYATLVRDLEMKKQRYEDLNQKMAQSQIATDLENRKQGETLELLDPASLPERPAKPVRSIMVIMGVVLGIGFGGLFVFLREVKDTSLKTLKDVRAYTQLTIMGSVPLLENDLVVMRRRRMAWLGWTAACAFAIAAMAGSIYYYYATKV